MTASNELVVHENGKTESAASFVRRTMFKGVPDEVLTLTMLMADRYDLDTVARHVVVIRFKNRDGQYTYQPYITRDGLLHVAHRSGKFDGITAIYGKDEIGEYAEATVWHKDMSHPIVYRAYRSEYDTGRNTWASHPIAMTTKTAEVIALRRAFDVSMTAREEMDAAIDRDGGAIIDAEVEYIPDPDMIDPPAPEPTQESPAKPRGNSKPAKTTKAARPLTPAETEELYTYAKSQRLKTIEDVLAALEVADIVLFEAYEPLPIGKGMIDAYSVIHYPAAEVEQPALLGVDEADTTPTNYDEGA